MTKTASMPGSPSKKAAKAADHHPHASEAKASPSKKTPITPVMHHATDSEKPFRKCHPNDIKNWGRFCQMVIDAIVKNETSVGAGCTTETLEVYFAKEKNREAMCLSEEDYEENFKLRTLLYRSMIAPEVGLINKIQRDGHMHYHVVKHPGTPSQTVHHAPKKEE